jgi:hypothetical protein
VTRHCKKHFEQSAPIVCARGNAYRLNTINNKKEMFMSKTREWTTAPSALSALSPDTDGPAVVGHLQRIRHRESGPRLSVRTHVIGALLQRP